MPKTAPTCHPKIVAVLLQLFVIVRRQGRLKRRKADCVGQGAGRKIGNSPGSGFRLGDLNGSIAALNA